MSFRQSTIARRCAEGEGRDAVHYFKLGTNQLLDPAIVADLAGAAARKAWRHGNRYLDLVGHEADLGDKRRRRRR